MLVVLCNSALGVAAVDDGLGNASAFEGTTADGCNIVVLERGLRVVGKCAIENGQLAIIIILDRVDATAEETAADRQLGFSMFDTGNLAAAGILVVDKIVIIVVDQAGK